MVSSLSYTIESSKLEKLETFKFLTSATEQHLKNIISPWKNIHKGWQSDSVGRALTQSRQENLNPQNPHKGRAWWQAPVIPEQSRNPRELTGQLAWHLQCGKQQNTLSLKRRKGGANIQDCSPNGTVCT